MRDPDAILLEGEDRKALVAVYDEVLGHLCLIPGRPSPLEELTARSIAADLWVANRHAAPVAAHDEARIQRTQSGARFAAAAEVGERSAIKAACWRSAKDTLKSFRDLREAMRVANARPAAVPDNVIRMAK